MVEDSSAQHADDRVPVMVRALSVSPQQRSQLGQLRRLFLQKLAKIVNDRKEINAQLLVSKLRHCLFPLRSASPCSALLVRLALPVRLADTCKAAGCSGGAWPAVLSDKLL